MDSEMDFLHFFAYNTNFLEHGTYEVLTHPNLSFVHISVLEKMWFESMTHPPFLDNVLI